MLFTPSVISSMDADSESVRESQDDLRREAERGEESGEREEPKALKHQTSPPHSFLDTCPQETSLAFLDLEMYLLINVFFILFLIPIKLRYTLKDSDNDALRFVNNQYH